MAVTVRRLAARHTALIAVITVVMLLALPTITYPLGRDQGEFATIGRGLLWGRVPYVDLWNPKPPAVFYVYAAAIALFGRTVEALRAIDLVMFPAAAAAVYAIAAWLFDRRTGLWAALITGVFYFSETFWTLTQNDGIALLPMTLAAWCGLRSIRRGRRGLLWALAAGALCGWAFWFKYPFALFAGALGVGCVILAGRVDWRWIFAFGLGFAAVFAAGATVLMAQGAWDALVESAVLTAEYVARGFTPVEFFRMMTTALGFRWAHWGFLFVLALIGLAGVRAWGAQRGGLIFTALWLSAGAVIMLVQGKGYDYHWLPMLPPLAIFGALGVETVLRMARRFVPSRALDLVAAGGLLAVLAFAVLPRTLPYLSGQEDRATYYARFQAGEFVADESLRVADYLRERVQFGDTLYIWGFRPEVYYLSDLNPATRWIFHFPLVADWYPAQWRAENVETLWAALPPYTLVLQADYLPWVTGSSGDSATLLQAYADLNDWLIYNYAREAQIGNFLLWRRKTT